jgi:hypothetical protein
MGEKSFEIIPAKGIAVGVGPGSADSYQVLRTKEGEYDFFGVNQNVFRRSELATYLAHAEKADGQILFDHALDNGVEVLSTSRALNKERIPEEQLQSLESAFRELAKLAEEDTKLPPKSRIILRDFKLPSPRSQPEFYRIFDDGGPRLIILWGCERDPGSSLRPLEALAELQRTRNVFRTWGRVLAACALLALLALLLFVFFGRQPLMAWLANPGAKAVASKAASDNRVEPKNSEPAAKSVEPEPTGNGDSAAARNDAATDRPIAPETKSPNSSRTEGSSKPSGDSVNDLTSKPSVDLSAKDTGAGPMVPVGSTSPNPLAAAGTDASNSKAAVSQFNDAPATPASPSGPDAVADSSHSKSEVAPAIADKHSESPNGSTGADGPKEASLNSSPTNGDTAPSTQPKLPPDAGPGDEHSKSDGDGKAVPGLKSGSDAAANGDKQRNTADVKDGTKSTTSPNPIPQDNNSGAPSAGNAGDKDHDDARPGNVKNGTSGPEPDTSNSGKSEVGRPVPDTKQSGSQPPITTPPSQNKLNIGDPRVMEKDAKLASPEIRISMQYKENEATDGLQTVRLDFDMLHGDKADVQAVAWKVDDKTYRDMTGHKTGEVVRLAKGMHNVMLQIRYGPNNVTYKNIRDEARVIVKIDERGDVKLDR